MKLSDDARKAIHDWRWGPYIDDPIERQEAVDAMIRVVMDAFAQLEAEVEGCRKLAHEYITAYEKFAFENGIAELEAEVERLRGATEKLTAEDVKLAAEYLAGDGAFPYVVDALRAYADALH